jgi:hypothetical protein
MRLENQETGISKPSARTATKLLKVRPNITTVVHAKQLGDTANRFHFCRWFLQSVAKCEIDPL